MNYRHCKAKSKRTGERCKARAMNGSDYCYHHGGASLKGAAHPSFKHGQRSKHMPVQLATRYEAALSDPQLGDLTTNIALREAFIRERLEALDKAPDPAQVWQQMTAQLNALEVAYGNADATKMAQGLRAMRGLISERTRYHQTRNEIEGALNDQRRDIESEQGILHKGENAIPVAQVVNLFAGFSAFIVREFADDQHRMSRVLEYVDSVLALPGESVGAGAGTNGRE